MSSELPKYFKREDIKRCKLSRSRIIKNNKYKRSKEEIHKDHQEKCKVKSLHGQFRKAKEEVRDKRPCDSLKKRYLKKETESTIIAAQDKAYIQRI